MKNLKLLHQELLPITLIAYRILAIQCLVEDACSSTDITCKRRELPMIAKLLTPLMNDAQRQLSHHAGNGSLMNTEREFLSRLASVDTPLSPDSILDLLPISICAATSIKWRTTNIIPLQLITFSGSDKILQWVSEDIIISRITPNLKEHFPADPFIYVPQVLKYNTSTDIIFCWAFQPTEMNTSLLSAFLSGLNPDNYKSYTSHA